MEFIKRNIKFFYYTLGIITSAILYYYFNHSGSVNFAQVFFYLTLFLLVLDFLWLDEFLSDKFHLDRTFGIFFLLGTLVVCGLYFTSLPGHDHQASGGKMTMVMQVQSVSTSTRYTLSFIPPEQPVEANKDVTLKFRIYNADTGQQVTDFDSLYTKSVHLVIVDNELMFFNHIHPTLQNGEFSVVTQFPKVDLYHLYLNFQPSGGLEQQFAVSLPVGNAGSPLASTQQPDNNLTKTFGDYNVTLVKEDDFRAADMSKGLQTMTFGISYKSSGLPAINLVPYLGAFGHLTLINEKTYDYIHVHPITAVTEGPNQHGGPSIEFVPLGLFGNIKPGIYRAFMEFAPAGKMLTADFTIEIK